MKNQNLVFFFIVSLSIMSTHPMHDPEEETVTCCQFPKNWFDKTIDGKPSLDHLYALTFTPNPQDTKYFEKTIHEIGNALDRDAFDGAILKLSNNNFAIEKGIPSKLKQLIIFVPGYTGMSSLGNHRYAGSVAEQIYYWCKNGLIHCPCVTFYMPTSYRITFNFGQELDQTYFDIFYKEVVSKNPDAEIILMGNCHGATLITNYITNQTYNGSLKPIKAVVIESPSLSLEAMVEQTAQHDLPYGLQWMLSPLFRCLFTKYKWDMPTLLDKKIVLPDHLAVLIGFLNKDEAVNPEITLKIVNKLQEVSQNVDYFKSKRDDLTHGFLGKDLDYQKKVCAFLKKYKLR